MAAGIMIMGSSGAGKTTLGKMAAERLGFTFVILKNIYGAKIQKSPSQKCTQSRKRSAV